MRARVHSDAIAALGAAFEHGRRPSRSPRRSPDGSRLAHEDTGAGWITSIVTPSESAQ